MKDINLKEIRKRLGISQQRIAEMLCVTMRMVQYYEAGKVVMPDYRSSLLKYKLDFMFPGWDR